MKLKLYTFIASVLLLAISSCKTASKLYQKGNYDEAVELAAKKLQKDPNDAKLNELIRNSYRLASEDHQRNIRNYATSNNEMKWEWTFNEYAALQKMFDAIHKVAAVFNLIQPEDFSTYLITYGEKAGQVHYDRGQSYFSMNTKENARRAYREFQAALRFMPNNGEYERKMGEAYFAGLVNVVILPVEQDGFRYSTFNYSAGNFDDAILRNLRANGNNEFVKYYSSWEARDKDIPADEVIDMRFLHLDIGGYFDTRNKREVTKEVVIKETVFKPDSIVREYGKVHAQITTTTRTMNSEGMMQVNIRDGSGRWLWSNDFRGTHYWRTEFATYTGDVRALDDNDKALVNQAQAYPPREEEIVRCILETIDHDLVYKLKEHFSSY